ncbi:HMG box-containing protein 1-like isoform X1 [Syngnathoides biaculeatus]|uniref:HMG box-containing protein 1-like isoform X1 n=2 Tax=Syngnathoides biaculeatus TaxID=300417 RepID=UPI002ADDD1D7|nr:HMG box-containing protein 1-like isoform X1 [Syngnathoides biaculeatus]
MGSANMMFMPTSFPRTRPPFSSGIMMWEMVIPKGLSGGDPKQHKDPEPGRERTDEIAEVDQDQSREPSHGTSSDTLMEYADLPNLEEVPEEKEMTAVYQVEVGLAESVRGRRVQLGDTRWLTQLAHIATGPQSPLLQEPPRSSCSSAQSDLHSYARPPPANPGSKPSPRRGRTSSERSAEASARSSPSDDEDTAWSVSWPATAWHCFLKGTHLRFHSGAGGQWQNIEDLQSGNKEQSKALKGYGSEGLQLVAHSENVLSGQAVLQLTFDPGAFGQGLLTARCQLDHPFYVKNKGWSSFYPSLTVVHYGIAGYEMELGDVCLPPGHRDAEHTDDSLVFDTFKSYDFTPLDSSAVYLLSSMARRRYASQSSGGTVSPDRELLQDAPTPGHSRGPYRKPIKSQSVSQPGSNHTAPKCKRPMNAFMLFAKKFRVQYTQMHPGKDNRAISVLLGERWKKMRSEERRVFTLQAKALADERKRLDPDCWKRKRADYCFQGDK